MKRIKHLRGSKEVQGYDLNRGDQFIEASSIKYFFSMECAPYVKVKPVDGDDFEAFFLDYYERVILNTKDWYIRLNKHQKKHIVNGRKYIFEEKEYDALFDELCSVEEFLIFEE